MSFGGPLASHTYYSYRVPSRTDAPCARGTCAFKFPRICGSAGTSCAYICDFSINWPVACCLFLSSLKRTLDT